MPTVAVSLDISVCNLRNKRLPRLIVFISRVEYKCLIRIIGRLALNALFDLSVITCDKVRNGNQTCVVRQIGKAGIQIQAFSQRSTNFAILLLEINNRIFTIDTLSMSHLAFFWPGLSWNRTDDHRHNSCSGCNPLRPQSSLAIKHGSSLLLVAYWY